MARRSVIDVFRYLDYRRYLADYYQARKPRGFSYRVFSRAAGLKSPNYLKLVIDGERNLTAAMATRFAEACGLHGEGADYFRELVQFDQARDDASRDAVYMRMAGFQRYRRAQRIELAHAAYHANWYMPAIRELVGSPDFEEDAAWIAARLLPAIQPREAARAVKLLLELGLLERDDDGVLQQTSAVVSTGPQTASMHIGNYHRAMMQQAADAIERVPAWRRDLSSLTLRMRGDSMDRLKERLTRFRRELLEMESEEVDADQVLQLNLQLFPLTISGADEDTPSARDAGTAEGDSP